MHVRQPFKTVSPVWCHTDNGPKVLSGIAGWENLKLKAGGFFVT